VGTLVDPTEEVVVPLTDSHRVVGLHARQDHDGICRIRQGSARGRLELQHLVGLHLLSVDNVQEVPDAAVEKPEGVQLLALGEGRGAKRRVVNAHMDDGLPVNEHQVTVSKAIEGELVAGHRHADQRGSPCHLLADVTLRRQPLGLLMRTGPGLLLFRQAHQLGQTCLSVIVELFATERSQRIEHWMYCTPLVALYTC